MCYCEISIALFVNRIESNWTQISKIKFQLEVPAINETGNGLPFSVLEKNKRYSDFGLLLHTQI